MLTFKYIYLAKTKNLLPLVGESNQVNIFLFLIKFYIKIYNKILNLRYQKSAYLPATRR